MNRLRGRQTRAQMRELLRLKRLADRKRPSLTTSRELESEALMREITPPLQTPEERGQGDSINARLHKLLYG